MVVYVTSVRFENDSILCYVGELAWVSGHHSVVEIVFIVACTLLSPSPSILWAFCSDCTRTVLYSFMTALPFPSRSIDLTVTF
jgi:hypothetical protein